MMAILGKISEYENQLSGQYSQFSIIPMDLTYKPRTTAEYNTGNLTKEIRILFTKYIPSLQVPILHQAAKSDLHHCGTFDR